MFDSAHLERERRRGERNARDFVGQSFPVFELATGIYAKISSIFRRGGKSLQLELPHHGNEKLLDLLDGAS